MDRKILVLIGRYYPKPSANSICMDHVIRLLVQRGDKVTCICYDDGEEYSDDKAIVRKLNRGFVHSALYRLEDKRSKAAGFLKHYLNVCHKLRMLFFLPCWPWTDPVYTFKLIRCVQKLDARQDFDVVIAVHTPLSSLIAGSFLKKKKPDMKYYPYFLDSLSGGIPLKICSPKWNIKKGLRWEKKVLGNADKIIVMESSRKHHEQYSVNMPYYSKFVYLDIPLLTFGKKAALPPQKKDRIDVLFCGTANYPLRNIPFFLKLVSYVKSKKIRFTIIGDTNCKELKNHDNENIQYIPAMPHGELEEYLDRADFLLNFGVTTEAAISGKIFEYMSYGKPIISTFSIDSEACIPYLQKYPLALLIDERKEINKEAQKMEDFIEKNRNKRLAFSVIRKTFYKNTPEAFINEIMLEDDSCKMSD